MKLEFELSGKNIRVRDTETGQKLILSLYNGDVSGSRVLEYQVQQVKVAGDSIAEFIVTEFEKRHGPVPTEFLPWAARLKPRPDPPQVVEAACDCCKRAIPEGEVSQAPLFGDRRSLYGLLQAPLAPMQCTGCGVWLCCICLNTAHAGMLASGDVQSSSEGLHHACGGYFEFRRPL